MLPPDRDWPSPWVWQSYGCCTAEDRNQLYIQPSENCHTQSLLVVDLMPKVPLRDMYPSISWYEIDTVLNSFDGSAVPKLCRNIRGALWCCSWLRFESGPAWNSFRGRFPLVHQGALTLPALAASPKEKQVCHFSYAYFKLKITVSLNLTFRILLISAS